jgi:hypothetical protein
MSDEPSNHEEVVYHVPEMINGQWYYFVETSDPFGSVSTYGPFPSRHTAQTHQDEATQNSE